MRAKWPVLAMLLALGAGYIGYPYVTLYRLDTAVRHSDAATLRSLVDWYSVREGLKEDICDMVLEDRATPRAKDELPPFGASFVRGMTASVVDQRVTPETLVSMSNAPNIAVPSKDARLTWAFFDSPTQFSVAVSTSNSAEPIRVVMELRGMRWRVRRVWLPNNLLERAGTGEERRVSLLAPSR